MWDQYDSPTKEITKIINQVTLIIIVAGIKINSTVNICRKLYSISIRMHLKSEP